MDYKTFEPHPDLSSFIKHYWTLEVPADNYSEKQRIIPDGCIEMAFILGDDIRRYISENEFIIQPRAGISQESCRKFQLAFFNSLLSSTGFM